MKVRLNWTNPTTTLDGTPLNAIEQIVVLRDNEIVATLTDVVPGAAMEIEDVNVPRYDVYHYAVYAVANERVGKHANVMCRAMMFTIMQYMPWPMNASENTPM